jgi:hypothetical protein
MKSSLALTAVRMAWSVITIGQRLVRAAERLEERAGEPYTVLCSVAWRLMTLGERVEALGEALEARADLWARRAGCDMESLLAARSA